VLRRFWERHRVLAAQLTVNPHTISSMESTLGRLRFPMSRQLYHVYFVLSFFIQAPTLPKLLRPLPPPSEMKIIDSTTCVASNGDFFPPPQYTLLHHLLSGCWSGEMLRRSKSSSQASMVDVRYGMFIKVNRTSIFIYFTRLS
jgi:hypothetical protein